MLIQLFLLQNKTETNKNGYFLGCACRAPPVGVPPRKKKNAADESETLPPVLTVVPRDHVVRFFFFSNHFFLENCKIMPKFLDRKQLVWKIYRESFKEIGFYLIEKYDMPPGEKPWPSFCQSLDTKYCPLPSYLLSPSMTIFYMF